MGTIFSKEDLFLLKLNFKLFALFVVCCLLIVEKKKLFIY